MSCLLTLGLAPGGTSRSLRARRSRRSTHRGRQPPGRRPGAKDYPSSPPSSQGRARGAGVGVRRRSGPSAGPRGSPRVSTITDIPLDATSAITDASRHHDFFEHSTPNRRVRQAGRRSARSVARSLAARRLVKSEDWVAAWLGLAIIALVIAGVRPETPKFKWATESAVASTVAARSAPAWTRSRRTRRRSARSGSRPRRRRSGLQRSRGDRPAIGKAARDLGDAARTAKDGALGKKGRGARQEPRGRRRVPRRRLLGEEPGGLRRDRARLPPRVRHRDRAARRERHPLRPRLPASCTCSPGSPR